MCDIVSTTVLSSRVPGSKKFASVTCDASVRHVVYRVFPTKGDKVMEEGSFAGEVRCTPDEEEATFVFPMKKGFTYFVNLVAHIKGEEKARDVSFHMDPFKRRQVPKPAASPAPDAKAEEEPAAKKQKN